MFIYATYPTSASKKPLMGRESSTVVTRVDESVRTPTAKSQGGGKEALLENNRGVELSIALVPATPKSPGPSVVLPDNDQPVITTKPVSGSPRESPRESPRGSPRGSGTSPDHASNPPHRNSQHLEAPIDPRISDPNKMESQGNPSPRKSPSKQSPKLVISPRSPKSRGSKPSSPSSSRHVFVALKDEAVEEEDEMMEVPERRPTDKPRAEYDRLDDDLVEVSEAKEPDKRDIEQIE